LTGVPSRSRPRSDTLEVVRNQPVVCGRYDAVFALDDRIEDDRDV
jgi:hypothetical protein